VVPGSGQGDPLLWHGVPNAASAGTAAIFTLHSTATGGTINVAVDGVTVATLFDAHLGTAADLQAAINADLGAGYATVGGGPFGTADLTVTFPNTGVHTVTVDPANAVGGTVTSTNSTAAVAAVPAPYTNRAAKGALLADVDNGTFYVNTGTLTAPVWTGVTIP